MATNKGTAARPLPPVLAPSPAAATRCVACNRLAYSSTREDRLTRLNRRGQRLTDRLRAEPAWVLNWLLPPVQPPEMHARTYARLCRAWWAVWREANGVVEADLKQLIARTELILGERRGNGT